ncbi:MAG: CDP-glycerol glycerophosphotransferase family protein [Mogibacterium sp.]|nr:CDP-glycerol glycerophosphotransferase family protein [Mogibacterium sp.]
MKFDFSVVMPLYNSGKYLQEGVGSILKQDLGFRDHIQLILVNDGSTDDTEEQCLAYQQEYLDNVVYVRKENGGVSSARNEGIGHIQGEFTVFLDGDDCWAPDAFREIRKFLDANGEGVDVCSCKMTFIGDYADREHPLDYKFRKGNRVVDLLKEPEYVNSTIGNVVVRSSAIGDVRFNKLLPAGEDAVFTNSILLGNPKLGIIATAVFYYRRNFKTQTGSSSAPNRKSWFFEVPQNYYLGLYEKSKARYGEILPFIQRVVAYDLQWRHYNPKLDEILTAEEQQKHLAIMTEVVRELDDGVIFETPEFNQYWKIYLYRLKHGQDYLDHLRVDRWYLVDEKDRHILNFQAQTAIRLHTVEVDGDRVLIQGVTKMYLFDDIPELYAKDEQGTVYEMEILDYLRGDLKGYIGEEIVHGKRFKLSAPLHQQMKLGFYVRFRGNEYLMNPGLSTDTGLLRHAMSYCIKGGYMVKYVGKNICFYHNTPKIRRTADLRYRADMLKKKEFEELKSYGRAYSLDRKIRNWKLKDQVAFVTPRSQDELLPNLKTLYDAVDAKKVLFARIPPYSEQDTADAAEVIYQSKVVVTDDYLYFLRFFGKKPGQKVIQIWHAAGAFKKFGQDGTELFPAIDASYHRTYDLVSVSAPAIEPLYAQAFDLPVDRVRALGVPRTDLLFRQEYAEAAKEKIYGRYPELRGKRVVLYAPTFRNYNKDEKHMFTPDLDFSRLEEALGDDQVFIICPHPIITSEILTNDYKNIKIIRDISTNEMMQVADLMVTDYSSVIFEFSLLRKPMAFFCYDYDYYNRDFYLDYETELPGPLFKEQDGFIEYIREGRYVPDERMDAFVEKFMSACDGHSSERIAEVIKGYLA